jgi:hypothetical protein
VLGGEKGGRADWLIQRLLGYIETGLGKSAPLQQGLEQDVEQLRWLWTYLDECNESPDRAQKFDELVAALKLSPSARQRHMAKTALAFRPGLFVTIPGAPVPIDNLDMERSFKAPKGHRRRITGRAHAGAKIVREGPTLLPTLLAHQQRNEPFRPEELLAYRNAREPAGQRDARLRNTLGRHARSTQGRPHLLIALERQFRGPSE